MIKIVRAFVKCACRIDVALETGKDALVCCSIGRSRSPSVTAAFFVLFRGVSLDGEGGIKCWFQEAYAAQRPETARVSLCFPNLEKFEAILNLLAKCRASPSVTIRGFNLAGEC